MDKTAQKGPTRHFFIRVQLLFVSIILLATLAMMMNLVIRHNKRWDLTGEKIYSISKTTSDLLAQMQAGEIEVTAFYPAGHPDRDAFETFLKACQMHHDRFEFRFYDPDRHPQMARAWKIDKLYTVVIRYGGQKDQVLHPNEGTFANTLLRLIHPRAINVCFVTGHAEASLWSEERTGLKHFRETLEENKYTVHEILPARDQIPSHCHLIVAAGPQRDWEPQELDLLEDAMGRGQSVLFLIDPVDPGTGKSIENFLKDLGIRLGADVIVDKMSRMVGGDFLVPFVNQYVAEHPITEQFELATFFPVARSVQPVGKTYKEYEITPLALTGSGSWAETNLSHLEKGEAAYESETDLPGPIPIAAALEMKKSESGGEIPPGEGAIPLGRMVVVGDSDFITNAYVELSGNKDLALKMVQWLAKDERSVILERKPSELQPLFLNLQQRLTLLVTTLLILPLFFLLIGAVNILWRQKFS